MARKRDLPEAWQDEEEIKSKTQVKQEMHDLQDLGKAISELPKAVYKSIDVPDALDEAIQTLARIKNWNAQKRQLQYIGRVMRELSDEELKNLQQAFNDYEIGRKKLNREFQQLEKTRELLIAGDQEKIQSLLEEYPNIERQQLMQTIRAAQKEHKKNNAAAQGQKQDKQFKKLFQFLKQAFKDSNR